MTGHNYPKNYTITGVAGDVWHGNEETIYEPTWFIEKDGENFYCSSSQTGWKESELKPLSVMDRDYVRWFDEGEYVGINEGENLYLAGHKMIGDLEELIEIGLINSSVCNWKPVGNKHYYAKVMTPAAYDAFVKNLLQQTWKIVEDYIRSGLEPVPYHTNKAFNAYSALYYDGIDKKERHLRKGAFYLRSGDARQFEIESFMACLGAEKAFPNERTFQAEVHRLIQEL